MSDRNRPNAWNDDGEPFVPSLTVYESAPESVDTGLLDINGTKIFRRPAAPFRIGFDLSGKT